MHRRCGRAKSIESICPEARSDQHVICFSAGMVTLMGMECTGKRRALCSREVRESEMVQDGAHGRTLGRVADVCKGAGWSGGR